MKLYHGTAECHLPTIRAKGLQPRALSKQTNWKQSVESSPKVVYLTNAYALYFALQACTTNSTEDSTEKCGRAVVFEIETDRLPGNRMVPDEDVLEQITRTKDKLSTRMDMNKRVKWYRDRLPDFIDKKAHDGVPFWMYSLICMGTCGYMGAIPTTAITRVALIDFKVAAPLCWQFLQPTITMKNYQFFGKQYRAYSQWIFGDEPSAEDLPAPSDLMRGFEWPAPFTRDGIEIEEFQKVMA